MPDGDPAEVAVARETIRLAFVAALQHLPPRQRAVLILCEVLRWQATEVAELLETSVASVNSALQRARATLVGGQRRARATRRRSSSEDDRALLARYVDAFERYDMDALTSLIQEDATQSMPPFDLWLQRPRRHPHVVGRARESAAAARGSCRPWRPTARRRTGSTSPARPAAATSPWALQVIEIEDGRIVEFTFFLDTDDAVPALRPAAAARRLALIRQARPPGP